MRGGSLFEDTHVLFDINSPCFSPAMHVQKTAVKERMRSLAAALKDELFVFLFFFGQYGVMVNFLHIVIIFHDVKQLTYLFDHLGIGY